MCIIVAKPIGVKMPSEKILQNCWNSNPDGAGFAVASKKSKSVSIKKGFMAFEAFKKAISGIKNAKNKAIILHFRIATSGGIRPDVTHPYPVDNGNLRNLTAHCNLAIAHNGIIPNMLTDKRTSDTMAFVRDIVAPLLRICPDLINNNDALGILETVALSKLALIDKSGNIATLGDFVEDDGIYYSNCTYIGYRPKKTTKNKTVNLDYPFSDEKNDYGLFEVCEKCIEYEDCKELGPACYDAFDAKECASAWPKEGSSFWSY